MLSWVCSKFSISSAIPFSKHHFFQTDNQRVVLFTVFSISLLGVFFSDCIVVAVAKENLLETQAIVSLANFQHIQMLRHPRLAFDWLSVSFFDYWPIRMSGLLLLCTELTLFCTELPENCIYLNQSELSNFFMYIIRNSNEPRSWSWGKIEELKSFPIIKLYGPKKVVDTNKFSLCPGPSPPPSLSPFSPLPSSLSPPPSPLLCLPLS